MVDKSFDLYYQPKLFAESGDPMINILESNEMADALGDDERKILDTWKKTKKKEKANLCTYSEKLKEHRHTVAKRQVESKIKRGKPDPKLKTLISNGTRMYPNIVTANMLSEEQANIQM